MNYIQEKVKELRQAGLSYQQIGDLLGFSRQYAHQLYSGYQSMATLTRRKFRKTLNYIIKRRDDDSCQFCGSQDALILHHKDSDTRHNESYNLITMCQRCHRILHNGWSRA